MKNIILVDDNRYIVEALALTIAMHDATCNILKAKNGKEAVDILRQVPVDLILTDINMPVMDGLKLVSLVRQNAQLKNIPIIIITTEGAEEDRERGLALGANAYISKPIQSSHLIKTISELLSV